MEYKINVPEDCELIVTREGQMAIIEVVPKEPVFKENDIVYTEHLGYGRVSILKNSDFSKSPSNTDMSVGTKVTMHIKTNFSLVKDEYLTFSYIRLATESEKQLLFDKLKEKCLMFDGENVVRWRAAPYKKYFYLPVDVDIAETEDDMSNWDDGAYHIGNYFPTREMAEAFQKVYIESLNNFHKNL